jgi:hypothetical protein
MKHFFILSCLALFCPFCLAAQTFSSSTSGTDATLSITGAYDSTLMFMLYGDGYFASGEGSSLSRNHRYADVSQSYPAEVWLARKKHTSPPARMATTVTTGNSTGSFTNSTVSMSSCIKLGASWLPQAGNKHFAILTFTNKCDKTVDGKVKFYYDSNQELITSDIKVYNSWVSGLTITASDDSNYDKMLIWDYTGLAPGEQRHIYLFCKTKTGTSEGTNIKSKASITNACCDGQLVETSLSLKSNKYPHDPNQKKVNPTQICAYNPPEQLDYYISFYNDGDTFVNDVDVRDIFDFQLEFPTLALTGSDAPCNLNPAGPNTMHFNFPGIKLPGINQTTPFQYTYDETVSSFTFSINTIPCLHPGAILNSADIFFDALPPVTTDIAKTDIVFGENCYNACGMPHDALETQTTTFAVSPNPFNDRLQIHLLPAQPEETNVVDVLDIQGRSIVQQTVSSQTDLYLQTADWPSGLYMVRLQNKRGIQTIRVVKQ